MEHFAQPGVTQHEMHDCTTTLQSNQRALTILITLFVEEHDSTDKSYRESGVT